MRIIAEDVDHRYRRTTALSGVDLDIDGGVFGLVGPNGAGKTTLLRLLVGILRPRSGRLLVGGHDLSRGAARNSIRRSVGYLPERPMLYPHLTTREFLDYAALLNGITDARQRRERTGHVMEQFSLTLEARSRIGALSTGGRQRVAIAKALIGSPRLLVLDEPTVGLDPLHHRRLRTLVEEVGKETTVVLSTHVLDDVARLCDRVAVLRTGTIAFTGTPGELAATAPHGPDLEEAYAALVSA